MTRVRSCLLLLAVSGAALACEDKVISSSASSSGSAAPARAKSAAPPAPSAPPPRAPIDESEFVESELSRDPFRSYAKSFVVRPSSAGADDSRVVLMKEYSLDELKLIGIVTRITPAKAMLVDPTGRGHVIQRGQFLGRADMVQTSGRTGATYEVNWRVDRIREGDVVLVREDPNNPDLPSATKVIPLRPEGTLIEGVP